MRFYEAVVLLSPLLLPLASAECYNDEIRNTNTQLAHNNIRNVAKFLQGTLVGRQERGTCVTDTANGSQWYFGIRSMTDSEQQVTENEIDAYLTREVNGCKKHGGFRREGNVEYKYVCPNADRDKGITLTAGFQRRS